MLKQYMMRFVTVGFATLAALTSAPSQAELALSNTPLFLAPSVPPLNMLVVGRDHKLYYEAYNDASDLNGDGVLDVGYKGYLANNAGGIDYYGYFDSYKCYTYSNNTFSPTRLTANKRCSGEWSGDFLNYLTMSRIDALRKVLYGGKRDVDTDSATVLIRSHIPMDAHSWGKEYSADAPYDIAEFTPFTRPPAGQRHLFANTTPNVNASSWTDDNGAPMLRVLLNRTYRIWEWVSKESPVAGTIVSPPSGDVTVTMDRDLQVRVQACVTGLIGNENCKQYPHSNYKPVGLLHEFGENDAMLFGLLTGSYTANKSGGVLRKNMGSISNEINTADGTLTNVNGIIRTLDKLRAAGYTRYTSNGGTNYDCGLPAMAKGPITDGSCRMWGNPVAEMMYETLRYFRGKTSGSPAFTATKGGSNTNIETLLGLPRPAWVDPYSNRPVCSKPFQTVMADINNSYDSDQLPGSYFSLETGSDAVNDTLDQANLAPAMNVATLAQEITDNEPGITGLRFIGQSGALYDGSPRPKNVTSLGQIRGLAPEEPTKQGSYYPASVAYYGISNRANPVTQQKLQTFAVALASPLPKIEIPVGGANSGRTVTLVPFAKSVQYNSDIDRTEGAFQPTNQIVDFYVENISADRTSGTFQVSFEDVEAGNDHDMDAIVRYTYRLVDDNTVEVKLSSDYQAGGVIHHIGYVISGTTADGVYLVVQDCNKTTAGAYNCNGSDPNYFLDVPNDNTALPGSSTRQFTAASSGTGATVLKDPLWYAAKWGGFKDRDGNNRPNLTEEWDANGDQKPDNYFLVTNALTLSQQLRESFNEIINRSSSASAASVNSGAISTTTRIYQARFDTDGWTGQLFAYGLNADGGLGSTPVWEASQQIPQPASRRIFTLNSDNSKVPFTWATLDATRRTELHTDPTTAENYLNFVRGENVTGYRTRTSRLGDIVSSAPIYVGAPRGRYSDDLESARYSEFIAQKRERDGVVYVGANDGMLHAFKADYVSDPDGSGPLPARRVDDNGREIYAYIPKTVIANLGALTRPTYSHRYFVDGSPNSADVFINNEWRTVLIGGLNLGGQGIYAIDVTDPNSLGQNSVLWEINDRTSTDFRDLGYTYSQPAIVRLHDGTWAAVFGNGYNNTTADGAASTTGNGVLYIVNIETGQLLRKFDTRQGTAQDPTGAGRPNGLATPTLVDLDGDRVVDYAYAGDLFGNLWKIDLTSSNPSEWDFAFRTAGNPAPFFVATNGGVDANGDGDTNDAADTAPQRQPITARVEVARGPYGAGAMIVFGTGKFLEGNDKLIQPRSDQSFYALLDSFDGQKVNNRSELTPQRIEQEYSLGDGLSGRRTSNAALMGKGWYLDLVSPANGYEGERVVTTPIVRDDRVIFNTLIPSNDACGFGGRSWTMVLDLLSGSRLRDGQFDTNGDGVIDGNDDQNASGISDPTDGGILFGPAGLRCVDGNCQTDRLLSSSTNGNLDERALRSLTGIRGRQSWRQIR